VSAGWGSGCKPASELVADRDYVKVGGRFERVTHVNPIVGREGWVRVRTANGVHMHPDAWPVEWMGVAEVDEARA
jgi:hypothetical protein